ncbi:MAG: hypothetical protein JWM43_2305 [Acidobacteriaceae bacterium]|nr:hypothetical protein [Acidobacteriaceae bacterium]
MHLIFMLFMRRLSGLFLCVVLMGGAIAAAAVQSGTNAEAWQVEMQRKHDALIATNGPGTDEMLRTQLLAMTARDQEARGMQGGVPKDKAKLVMASNLGEIDAALTTELKAVVGAHGWPTIALVGIEASNGAMLILTHTRDHAWQLSLLPQLVGLADDGKIDGLSLALVVDKELVSEGKPQRYGTQFKLVDGGMAMYAVEDPGGLDGIRARVFLPPMETYKKMLSEMYHLKATNKIVQPVAPKAAETP